MFGGNFCARNYVLSRAAEFVRHKKRIEKVEVHF